MSSRSRIRGLAYLCLVLFLAIGFPFPASADDALVRIPHDARRRHGAQPHFCEPDLPAPQAAADDERLDAGVLEVRTCIPDDVDETSGQEYLDFLFTLERLAPRSFSTLGDPVLQQRDRRGDRQRGDDPPGAIDPEAGGPALARRSQDEHRRAVENGGESDQPRASARFGALA